MYENIESTDAIRDFEQGIEVTEHDKSHRPRLISDNGSCYVFNEFSKFIHDQIMSHVRGSSYHRQTQGKIECNHRTVKITANDISIEITVLDIGNNILFA